MIRVRKRPKRAKNRVVYVRFGDIPENERSLCEGVYFGSGRNPKSSVLEKGVSCFEARRKRDGSLEVLAPRRDDGGLREMFAALLHMGRPFLEVRGDVVGRGLLGEPLLRNCETEEIPLSSRVRLCPPQDRHARQVGRWDLARKRQSKKGA